MDLHWAVQALVSALRLAGRSSHAVSSTFHACAANTPVAAHRLLQATLEWACA